MSVFQECCDVWVNDVLVSYSGFILEIDSWVPLSEFGGPTERVQDIWHQVLSDQKKFKIVDVCPIICDMTD